MSALNRWINQKIGLVVSKDLEGHVQHALLETARDMNLSVQELHHGLMCGTVNPDPFIERIVTSETFFFRYPEQMTSVAKDIVIPLINRGKKPEILCLPCSTGEEPYSFAMLLQSSGVNLDKVSITGVDVSKRCIDHAQQGIFNAYSFRRTRDEYRRRFFTPRPNELFQVAPNIQQAIKFYCLNLFENFQHINKIFDVIFFNNLLIYLSEQHTTQALHILKQHLAPDGWLIVDSTEAHRCREEFASQPLDQHIGFRHASTTAKESIDNNDTRATPRQNPTTGTTLPFRKGQLRTTKSAPVLSEPKPLTTELTPTGQSPTQQSTEQLLQRALTATHSKQFENAIECYEQALAQSNELPLPALVGLCKLYANLGRNMQAMEMAEQALRGNQARLSPLTSQLSTGDLADIHAVLALGFRSKGLHDAAKKEFELIMALDANHPAMQLYQQEGNL